MHPIPWYLAVLISVPQTILIIKLGFGLFNFKIPFWKCLMVSIIIAVFCFYLRKYNVSFTVNTLILSITLTALTAMIYEIKLRYSFVAVLLGVMISGVIESVLLPIFLVLTGYSMNDLMMNACINTISFIPIFLITLIIYWLSWRYKIVLFDFENRGNRYG